MQPTYTVIIPCYNEEKYIEDTLIKIQEYFDERHPLYEIIVVDDKSTDDTVEIVNSYILNKRDGKVRMLFNDVNRGKGYSVKQGLISGNGEYFLITDADLSSPISQFDNLLHYVRTYDFVLGSRKHSLSIVKKKQPLIRRIYSKGFNIIVNTLFNLGVSDTQCGFVLISSNLKKLIISCSKIYGFSYTIEYLLIVIKNNLKFLEVGIVWNDNKPQSVNFKQIKEMFFDLLKIKNLYNLGVYEW